MGTAKQGDTVRVHYSGKLDDGTVFDTSESRDPLEFTIGNNQVILGFEQAVVGMDLGETKTTTVSAGQAYGARDEKRVVVMSRERLPQQTKPEIGQRIQVGTKNNQKIDVIITKVSESSVTFDANHPLAGQDLTFEIRLLEVV